jgi:hypothetical protein
VANGGGFILRALTALIALMGIFLLLAAKLTVRMGAGVTGVGVWTKMAIITISAIIIRNDRAGYAARSSFSWELYDNDTS